MLSSPRSSRIIKFKFDESMKVDHLLWDHIFVCIQYIHVSYVL